MKTILYSIILLINLTTTSAQTQLKPAPLSTLSYLGNTLSLEDTSIWAPRVQKHFMLGWQWQGPSEKTNKRLHCNFFHDNFGYPVTRSSRMGLIPDSGKVKYIVWQFLQQKDTNLLWSIGEQMGFQFDPTAKNSIDFHNPIREDDTTGAVYGFKERDTVYGYLDTIGAADFDRYSLRINDFPLGSRDTGIVALSKPVIDDRFYQFQSGYTDTNTSRRVGRWWYLSLNLRRTNTTDTLMNNDILLTITLPYLFKVNNTTFTQDTIIFDSTAKDSVGSATSLPHGRGIVLPLRSIPLGADPTKLIITRKMLPKGTDTDRDITISAFFRVKSDADTTPPNPILRYWNEYPVPPSGRVEKLGIDVRYHGRGDVSIDWLRIGTPQLENELRGELDSTIWVHTDTTLKIIKSYIDNDRNFRLLSFYGKDECPPENYIGMRYYSALYDGRLSSEGGGETLPSTAMNYNNIWSGGIGPLVDPLIPTPIMLLGEQDSMYNFHIKFGYDSADMTQRTIGARRYEPNGSTYETTIALGQVRIKRSDSADYNYLNSSNKCNYSIEERNSY